SSYGGELGQQNMVNNYYRPGPATRKDVRTRIVEPFDSLAVWYISGNHMEGSREVTSDNRKGVEGDYTGVAAIISGNPLPFAPVTTESARRALKSVLRNAGATLPLPDTIDLRIISETIRRRCAYCDSYGAGTGIIDSQNS